MRQVERRMVAAIVDGKSWRGGNTAVTWSKWDHQDYCKVTLHGNTIGELWLGSAGEWRLTLSDCGWQTATTKSRLNALLGELVDPQLRIVQSDWQWWLHGRGSAATEWTSGLPFVVDAEIRTAA